MGKNILKTALATLFIFTSSKHAQALEHQHVPKALNAICNDMRMILSRSTMLPDCHYILFAPTELKKKRVRNFQGKLFLARRLTHYFDPYLNGPMGIKASFFWVKTLFDRQKKHYKHIDARLHSNANGLFPEDEASFVNNSFFIFKASMKGVEKAHLDLPRLNKRLNLLGLGSALKVLTINSIDPSRPQYLFKHAIP